MGLTVPILSEDWGQMTRLEVTQRPECTHSERETGAAKVHVYPDRRFWTGLVRTVVEEKRSQFNMYNTTLQTMTCARFAELWNGA